MLYIVGLIFISISAISESVMDKIQFHFKKSIFRNFNELYWNPKKSDKNKWKEGKRELGEKFLGSSTIFVWTTDAWHLFKFLHNSSFFIGFYFLFLFYIEETLLLNIYYDIIMSLIIYRIVYGLMFTLFFSKIFNKND